MSIDLIREGIEKLQGVTPGKWSIYDRGTGLEVHAPNAADSYDPNGTHSISEDDVYDNSVSPWSAANAEFIVWARNNMAAVLTHAQKRDEDLLRVTDALMGVAAILGRLSMDSSEDQRITDGFRALLFRLVGEIQGGSD